MRKKYDWKKILLISLGILLGLGLRLYFLRLDGSASDIRDLYIWFTRINDGGLWSLYSTNYASSSTNYPPLIPIIGSLWFKLPVLIKSIPVDTLFFKVLPTIFELALTIITIFIIAKSKIVGNYKNLLIFFVIAQPGLTFVTSGWGQFDSAMSLLVFLAIFLLWKDKLFWSTLIFFLAILTKPQAVLAVLVYFIYLLVKKQYKNLLIQAAFFISLLVTAALIFKICGNANFLAVYFVAVDFMAVVSANAFNLWWAIFSYSSIGVNDANLKAVGLGLFSISIVPALIYLGRKKTSFPEIMLVFGYIFLAFFMLPTQIHERYLYYSVALLSFAALINYKFFIAYFLLSINLFANCAIILRSSFVDQFKAFPDTYSNITIVIAYTNLLVFVSLFLHFWFKINNKRSFFDNDKKVDLEKIYPKT